MTSLRTLVIAAAMATYCVTGYGQTPVDQGTQQPATATAATGKMPMPMGDPDAQMARLDTQMKAMQAMHDKMMAAKTPEERSALMTENMKVMQESMAMMGQMGPGCMMGKGGMKDMPAMGAAKGEMPGMKDKGPMNGDMGAHCQMMDKRMQMMQSMMQLMMDSMSAARGKS